MGILGNLQGISDSDLNWSLYNIWSKTGPKNTEKVCSKSSLCETYLHIIQFSLEEIGSLF